MSLLRRCVARPVLQHCQPLLSVRLGRFTHPSTSTGTTSSSFVQTSPVLPASCGQHIHAPPSLATTVGQHDSDALPVVQTSSVPVTIPGQNPPALSFGSISQVQSCNTYCEAPQACHKGF